MWAQAPFIPADERQHQFATIEPERERYLTINFRRPFHGPFASVYDIATQLVAKGLGIAFITPEGQFIDFIKCGNLVTLLQTSHFSVIAPSAMRGSPQVVGNYEHYSLIGDGARQIPLDEISLPFVIRPHLKAALERLGTGDAGVAKVITAASHPPPAFVFNIPLNWKEEQRVATHRTCLFYLPFGTSVLRMMSYDNI